MSLTVTVAGSPVTIIANSCNPIDNESSASTAQFVIRDDAGTGAYTQNMVVTITDSVNGLQFAGYIDSAQPDLLNPGPNKLWTIICKDKTYLASKRQTLLPDYTGTLAGDCVTDLHAKYLAAEGITANYALRHDNSAATFGAGTLVNTSAANGDLELASAGSTYTKTETTTADFATGTLTNVTAASNALGLASVQALKFVASAAPNLGANLFTYVKIWNGSHVWAAGEKLVYSLYISGDSAQVLGGVDLGFSDGTFLRDSGNLDQNGLIAHPNGTVISKFATNRWYTRVIANLDTVTAGKTITSCLLGQEGDTAGNYTYYVHDITIQSSGGTVLVTIYSGGVPSKNVTVSLNGYYGVKLTNLTAYQQTGQRVSSAYSIASAGIVRNSLINWTAVDPVLIQPASSTTFPTNVTVESSFDGGATWQLCTNHAPLPNLLAGMNCASKTITLRETVSLIGPLPEATSLLTDLTFSIQPSYAMTKSDVVATDFDNTTFSAGTITNTEFANGGLRIKGAYRDWDNGDVSNETGYSSATNAVSYVDNGTRIIICDGSPGNDAKIRFDFAGSTWQNFIAEIDIEVIDNVNYNAGLLYRQTGWVSGNDTYAYCVQLNGSHSLDFIRATNGGASSSTLIATVALTLTVNQVYRVKVEANGTTHTIWLNDVQMINFVDATYTAAGYLGCRLYNSSGVRHAARFDNFGVMNINESAVRVSPSTSLAAVGTVESSIIQWNSSVPNMTSLLIEASTNGGSTYTACTNGATIPGCTPGTNVSALSLLIRETLTTQAASVTPYLNAITSLIVGNYNATGTRVSPSLAIGAVGRVGSSSITWTATTPTGTSLLVEESLVSATGAWTTATSGGVIPTITSQPVSVSDGFTVSTSANYTSTNYTSGVNATWTFDTANSRLVATNGTNGLYVWNQVSAKDMQFEGILNQAANAGLVWRYTNVSNFYVAVIADASASVNPNTIKLYKMVAGTLSGVLASGAITFTRGTYHTFRVIMSVTTITAYFDGVSIATVTDASLTGPGSVGLMQSSTTATNWYSIRGQQFGDDVTGKSVWTRLTLTSTDPTLTPAVTDLATSVRGQQLQSGIVIGQQNYQRKGSVMTALNDIATKCPGYTVGITDAGVLTFQSHISTPADWPLATVNSTLIAGQQIGDIQWSTPPVMKQYSPLYRNRSVIEGGTDITALITDTRMGDGFTQAWQLAYPVAVAPVLLLNGQIATVGVRGVDTGMQFYYLIGDPSISQDVSLTPLSSTDVLTIPYYGQIAVVKQSDNTAQQTIVAALEGGTSGIVEVVETIAGLNAVAAQAMADSRVAQYAILSQDFTFTTMRPGLHSGQLLQIFCPQYNLPDTLALITQVNQTILQGATDSSTLTFYNVTCTTGPNVGSWTALYV